MEVTRLFDRNADGVKNGADEYYEYSYNDQGQMTEIKYDGSDGKWNTTYEYDENGNKVKELIDYDLDGVPDEEKDINVLYLFLPFVRFQQDAGSGRFKSIVQDVICYPADAVRELYIPAASMTGRDAI